jgi:hypothetical protein
MESAQTISMIAGSERSCALPMRVEQRSANGRDQRADGHEEAASPIF